MIGGISYCTCTPNATNKGFLVDLSMPYGAQSWAKDGMTSWDSIMFGVASFWHNQLLRVSQWFWRRRGFNVAGGWPPTKKLIWPNVVTGRTLIGELSDIMVTSWSVTRKNYCYDPIFLVDLVQGWILKGSWKVLIIRKTGCFNQYVMVSNCFLSLRYWDAQKSRWLYIKHFLNCLKSME